MSIDTWDVSPRKGRDFELDVQVLFKRCLGKGGHSAEATSGPSV